MAILLVCPFPFYDPLYVSRWQEHEHYNPRTEGGVTKAAAGVNDGRMRARVTIVESPKSEATKVAASGDLL